MISNLPNNLFEWQELGKHLPEPRLFSVRGAHPARVFLGQDRVAPKLRRAMLEIAADFHATGDNFIGS